MTSLTEGGVFTPKHFHCCPEIHVDMQGLSSPEIPSVTLSMAFKREAVFTSCQSSKTTVLAGLFTEVTITSKISLNASSSSAS
jgi:bifunctional pyridoxal-dependent enzyme with beta-cystathionase and maltose regulon repressor activities